MQKLIIFFNNYRTRFLYFFKGYKTDFLVAILGIVGILIVWGQDIAMAKQQIISLIVIMLTLVLVVYIRVRQRDFIFSSLTSRKDKDFWIGYGKFQYNRTEMAYEIGDADPGYIYPDILTWSDYNMSFDFKIANWGGDGGGLGIIVRANNLANYIMLQIKKGGIAPHIRINRNVWSIQQPDQVNLTFSNISLDTWYRCEIICDKSNIKVTLYDNKDKIFSGYWNIPKADVIIEYTHSVEHPVNRMPIPITLEYGSAGFRNYGVEKAFVKNVVIKKL